MSDSLLTDLTEHLCCLPGVGPKSAQRMALHLLERDRPGGLRLANTMARAMSDIGNCARCRTFTEAEVCARCSDDTRNARLLCVAETPADVLAFERSTDYRGQYFVLMGNLSPLDGIGPRQIGLDLLQRRLQAEPLDELILATSATVEGETTAQYIAEMARVAGVAISRLAQGVPLGGELEYLDGGTLQHAFRSRQAVE
ncbi:MAG: recombination mediator RecR [Pseudomonadota bacterium]